MYSLTWTHRAVVSVSSPLILALAAGAAPVRPCERRRASNIDVTNTKKIAENTNMCL